MSFYLVEELEQGSDEWLAWRQGVIGASDAPVIMGDNPWSSPEYLIKRKLGVVEEFQGNAKTIEGKELEGKARVNLEREFKLKLSPVVVQDSREPFLAASLDGISKNYKKVFEIKSGAKAYEYTEQTGEVNNYYYAQLQHTLMVTEIEYITYALYRPSKKLLTLKIQRNDTYIKKLRKQEKEFVKQLRAAGHEIQHQFVGRLVNN